MSYSAERYSYSAKRYSYSKILDCFPCSVEYEYRPFGTEYEYE